MIATTEIRSGIAAPIHFRCGEQSGYVGAETSIFAPVQRHLASDAFTSGPGLRPGAVSLSVFIRKSAHVFMSHGMADKNYAFQTRKRQFRLPGFAHVLVPGDWMRRRILNHPRMEINPDRVHIVGWPRLDDLWLGTRLKRGAELRRPRVLWAPSHSKTLYGRDKVNLSSYPELEQYLPELERSCDVVTSLHPRNRRDKSATGHALVDADLVVSDFGTLVYEAWALGKPVIFPHWLVGDRILQNLSPMAAEHRIYAERIGLHARSMSELVEMVHARPVLDPKAAAFIADYLDSSSLGRSGYRIAALLMRLAADPPSMTPPADDADD